jgi:hypothetical protein
MKRYLDRDMTIDKLNQNWLITELRNIRRQEPRYDFQEYEEMCSAGIFLCDVMSGCECKKSFMIFMYYFLEEKNDFLGVYFEEIRDVACKAVVGCNCKENLFAMTFLYFHICSYLDEQNKYPI